jgi:hypothetical protein
MNRRHQIRSCQSRSCIVAEAASLYNSDSGSTTGAINNSLVKALLLTDDVISSVADKDPEPDPEGSGPFL